MTHQAVTGSVLSITKSHEDTSFLSLLSLSNIIYQISNALSNCLIHKLIFILYAKDVLKRIYN
jgi:hypothetical protein